MAGFDEIGKAYIQLAFAISQHIDGYVDAYAGPVNLRDEALDQGPIPAQMLVQKADTLLQVIADSDYSVRRRTYLHKQVRAMLTSCRSLAGETLSYLDEVEQCFDIVPQHIAEDIFSEAIEELQTLLPGNGTIEERVTLWRKQYEIPSTLAPQLLEIIEAELKQRTLSLYTLPANESVEFRLVSDKPWSGYNWYFGNYHSAVDINTDLPIQANKLTSLIAHEAYPGHHTEHCIKEAGLHHERGWAEHSIFLLNTPECVIAEGIANVGASILFEAGELERWQTAMIYPLAQIESDPHHEYRINAALKHLSGVSGNAALMLHHEGRTQAEVMAYLRTYGLSSEARAQQQLRFMSDALWRSYIFTYFYGEQQMQTWLSSGDKQARYGTLLREQVYPSLIDQWILDDRGACGL